MQSANGVTGHLLYTGDTYVFRVYHPLWPYIDAKDNFTDYDLLHNDLVVTIRDEDAYFYTNSFIPYLDHSPETLGIETTE